MKRDAWDLERLRAVARPSSDIEGFLKCSSRNCKARLNRGSARASRGSLPCSARLHTSRRRKRSFLHVSDVAEDAAHARRESETTARSPDPSERAISLSTRVTRLL